MSEAPSVFIVDDDEQVRSALTLLMESVGLKSESFSSAQEYLDQFKNKQHIPFRTIYSIMM